MWVNYAKIRLQVLLHKDIKWPLHKLYSWAVGKGFLFNSIIAHIILLINYIYF